MPAENEQLSVSEATIQTVSVQIKALTIGVAVGVSTNGGFAGSGAGAGSGNTVQNTVESYVNKSTISTNGAVTVSATDSPL